MHDEIPTITCFGELMNEFCYSYDYPNYQITHHGDGYNINKLYIEPDQVTYKTSRWVLAPGVYAEFEAFVNFLDMIERKK